MTPFEREWQQVEQARHAHLLQQLKRESKAKRQTEQAQAAAQNTQRETSRPLAKQQPALSLSDHLSDHQV